MWAQEHAEISYVSAEPARATAVKIRHAERGVERTSLGAFMSESQSGWLPDKGIEIFQEL